MTPERLKELLAGIHGRPVVVLGDFCLDRYGRGEIKGVSRETGQEVPRLSAHLFSPGAAGTVSWNLADLGAEVHVLGVVGDDDYGDVITKGLQQRGADASRLVRDASRPTPSFEKLKIEHPDGEVRELRIDVGTGPPGEDAVRALESSLRDLVPQIGLLVVADYDEQGDGVLTPPLREALNRLAGDTDAVCICTSRTHSGEFESFHLVPNEYELVTASGLAQPDIFDDIEDDLVLRAAEVLMPRLRRPIFITRGTRGMLIVEPDMTQHEVPTMPAEGELDITGAGDSALSAITMALAAGATRIEAAELGNMAANVTVRKIGITGTATPEELRDIQRSVFAGAERSA